MKIRFFLLFITLLFTSIDGYTQSVDDVTLVVVGTGNTKEEAVNNALRSAVEQAFGVFVSANTEIVNDELIKDEIATVTSGNIKSYKELSVVNLSDSAFTVSLEAVVSTKTLAVYAKSHGSSCEFAGATFGANLKLAKLNKINTEKVFENLIKQCEELIPHTFETSLEVGNPTANGDIPFTIYLYSTPNTFQLSDLIVSSISALHLSEQEIAQMEEMNIEIYPLYIISTVFQENGWIEDPYTKSVKMYLYASFPYNQIYNSLQNALDVYCIKDNLNNVYKVDLNGEIVSNNGRKNIRYGSDGTMSFAVYSFYNYGSDLDGIVPPEYFRYRNNDIIRLPFDYLRPKKSRQAKELTYPRKMIGKYSITLNIPVETLNQITSFEVTLKD